MQQRRFLLPALVAALLHAALLFAYVPGASARRNVASEEVKPERIPSPPRLEMEPAPANDPRERHEPVEQLADEGGPRRPESGEPPPNPLPDGFPIEVPPALTSRTVDLKDTTKISPWSGDGEGTGSGPGYRPFVVGDLDRVPRARIQVPPAYPYGERRAGTEAEVLVEFHVDPTGRVVSASIARSGGREFDAAALRAVQQWRFEPGRRNGHPVPFRMTVPLVFRLD